MRNVIVAVTIAVLVGGFPEASVLAEDAAILPKSIPPFALGDFCIASFGDSDGKLAIKLEMFGLRSRTVEISDDVPVYIDGYLANKAPFIRDTFSPTRRRTSLSTPPEEFRFWRANGVEVRPEELQKLLAKPRRAIVVNR
ncbi:MAG: hypothetical protein AAFU85_29265, partial [Planctomycetota bacterium]